MISSGVLYIIGDHVAQVGIEDKKWFGSWRALGAGMSDVKGMGKEEDGEQEGLFDWGRLARMTICTFLNPQAMARMANMSAEGEVASAWPCSGS
jgi:hypothetical protein